MRNKIEQLTHIDAETRKEVLSWCRDYELEIQHLKRQCALIRASGEDDYLRQVIFNITNTIKRYSKCSVFLNAEGKFKVLTESVRIAKERGESVFVCTYDASATNEDIKEDLLETLNDAREQTAPSS